jgi:tetratricopeptide (TPR) repeat protein
MAESPHASLTLGVAIDLHRTGQLQGAADIYRALLDHDPDDVDACYGLGTVRLQQGDFEGAVTLLKAVVDAAPDIPEYLFNYACALQQTGDHFAAVDNLESACRIDPDARRIRLTLAQALAKTRNYPAAIEAADIAFSLEAPNAAELLEYADLLFMAGQAAAAKDALAQARKLGCADVRALYLEARCERIAHNMDAARDLLNLAIERRPDYGDAWLLRIESAADDELSAYADNCQSLADLGAATAEDTIQLRYAAGRALERLNDYNGAFKEFEKANRHQRKDAESRGKRYDREANERFAAGIRNEFAVAGSFATPVPSVKQPVFIIGMPRSGTTLLEKILGGLDGVRMGGESEALQLVAAQYYQSHHGAGNMPVEQMAPTDWDELAARYWQLQGTPAGLLTDKTPSNFRHTGLIFHLFPDAPVVCMHRDPRDIALSIYTRRFPDGHPYATDLDDIAHYYAVFLQLMDCWRERYPERILDIAYEQLVLEPEEQSQKLAEFCGLTWQPGCLDVHQRRSTSTTFSELQVREPINDRGIGRWRNYGEAMQPFVAACVAQGVQLRDN